MNISVPFEVSKEIRKYLFRIKPIRRDGLLLNIHHSKPNCKIRFLRCCFDETGHILASADNDGHLYLIDFQSCKYWGLPKLDSCTFIKFSAFNQNDILCGKNNGVIQLIDLDSGLETGQLIGHTEPVTDVSFSQNIYCLSASQNEAIIWDLQTNSKHRVLLLDNDTSIKFVTFTPVSNNVLVQFHDDSIQMWNTTTFEVVTQFLPSDWYNDTIKSITLSRNGQTMVIACHSTLAVYNLNKWIPFKFITLPQDARKVKSVEYVSRSFDGGFNKILAILTAQGIICFFDVEEETVISKLKAKCNIFKFECCPNGNYIACVLTSGEVELYNSSQYVSLPDDVIDDKEKRELRRKRLNSLCAKRCELIKTQINCVLEIDKLKSILKIYGEYPEAYRTKIWERLLQIPYNLNVYNSVINHVTMVAFKDLYLKYPLENKTSIQNLKKLLNNMVTWCPFFAHVEYLPVLVFPFVKVFQNKPVSCFEAVCTVILNWCQHWFEYFPLPPVNTLAMIENVLMEHDPELLQCFLSNSITANLYAWPLLESAFSEVLTASEWLVLWDHTLTNEPSFLLCAAVAYNIINRNTLLNLKRNKDFEFFYHTQNPNDIKKFISKTYYILNNTSQKIHPRQYMEAFKAIQPGNYPLFVEFPKTIIDFQTEHIKSLKKEMSDIDTYQQNLILKAGLQNDEICIGASKMQEEEEVQRLKNMEKECLKKIEKEREKVKFKHDELQCLCKILGAEEDKVLNGMRKNCNDMCDKKQSRFCDYIMDNICCPRVHKNQLSNEQKMLLTQFAELLKYKYRIKELKKEDVLPEEVDKNILKKYRGKVDAEIDKVKSSLGSVKALRKLNIKTSIKAMEKLILNIERELQKETDLIPVSDSLRIKTLQAETIGLAKQVARLMDTMSNKYVKNQTGDTDEISNETDDHHLQENPSYKVLYSKNVRFSDTADG